MKKHSITNKQSTITRLMVLVFAALITSPALFYYNSKADSGWRENHSTDNATAADDDTTSADARTKARAIEVFAKQPLTFEFNRGQTDSRVKFSARGQGYNLFLTANEAVLALQPESGTRKITGRPKAVAPSAPAEVLRLGLAGANVEPQINGQNELPARVNYFIGDDSSKWRTDIATFAGVRYGNIYDGIDLIYYGNQRDLEYDFIVAPNADARTIRLQFAGAKRIRMNAKGELVLSLQSDDVKLKAPIMYQEIAGKRRLVKGRFVRRDKNEAGFAPGSYDHSKPLIIDPVLVYASYLGGSLDEEGFGIATDLAGNAYVTGYVRSGNFPILNPYINEPNNFTGSSKTDAFLTKFDANGGLIYSTFFGADDNDIAYGIAVDQSTQEPYITGATEGANFPRIHQLPGPIQVGGLQAFVTKFRASGNFIDYSVIYSGSNDDLATGIAVKNGQATFVGRTSSGDLPLVNPTQNYQGGTDAFYARIAFDGTNTSLVYSSYLGGTDDDRANTVAVDNMGNAYISGFTRGNYLAGFPNVGTNLTFGQAFATKVNPSGGIVFSALFGGNSLKGSVTEATGIALDSNNNVYACGYTNTTDFSTKNPFQPAFNGGDQDAFIVKINAQGTDFVYSSFLGGSDTDMAAGIAVNSAGAAFVVGTTYSNNFPTTPDRLQGRQDQTANTPDAFITVINPAGSAIVYSTYYGGSASSTGGTKNLGGGGTDIGRAVALSGDSVYVTGSTTSANLITANPFPPFDGFQRGVVLHYRGGSLFNNDSGILGNQDVFVLRLRFRADLQITKTVTSPSFPPPLPILANVTFTITLTNNGPDPHPGVVVTDVLSNNLAYQSSTMPAGWSRTVSPAGLITFINSMSSGSTAVFTITAKYKCPAACVECPPPPNMLSNSTTAAGGGYDPDTNNNVALVTFPVSTSSTSTFQLVCNDIVVANDLGRCDALVPDPALAFSCNVITYNPPLGTGVGGTRFPVGTTAVTASINNGLQTQMCTFNVTVEDREPPKFTMVPNHDITVPADSGGCSAVVTFPMVAVDNCDGAVVVHSNAPAGNIFPVGTTIVTLTAADSKGNQADPYIIRVTVTGGNIPPPTIQCPANITVPADLRACSAIVNFAAPATSSCPNGVVVSYSQSPGTAFPVGTTTVTARARDANGQMSVPCSFKVTVVDTHAPTITCPQDVRVMSNGVGVSPVVNYPPPTIADNCPGVTSVCNPPSGSVFPLGVTPVTCTATDAAGNTAKCTFNVATFDICIQNDTDGSVLFFSSTTGDYFWCCGQTYPRFTLTGRGMVTIHGSTITLTDTPADRRVQAKVDTSTKRAEAALQAPPGNIRCTISDRNITDNRCICP